MIVDAHLDLAVNALLHGRDLRTSLADIRHQERRRRPHAAGIATVCLPALRDGGVGLVFASLFAKPGRKAFTPTAHDAITYQTPDEANHIASRQLDYYHRLADEDDAIRLVGDITSLADVVTSHEPTGQGELRQPLLGIVPLMEGADPIRDPEELEEWYERGLRIIGPAWDDTRYAGSSRTNQSGFTKEGLGLLEAMADLGFLLDLSHLSEAAALQALERYEGRLLVSHANARSLVPEPRQLSDGQLRRLGERGGIVGITLYNPFLRRDQSKGERRERVTIDHVIAHIDHVCQTIGTADQVGIGSAMDGGFGLMDTPTGIDSSSDLGLIAASLGERGYDPVHIERIMGGNWLRLLRDAWDG